MPSRLPARPARPKSGPFPGARAAITLPNTTTPSDSRWPLPDFTTGLYRQSLLTSLTRRASPIPNETWRTCRSPYPEGTRPRASAELASRADMGLHRDMSGSAPPFVYLTRLQNSDRMVLRPARLLPPERLSTPRSARHLTTANRGLLPGSPAITRTGLSPAGFVQLPGRNTTRQYPQKKWDASNGDGTRLK
jgi:hypothetical protein